MRFFWMEFRQNKVVLCTMFLALVMWLGVLVMEGIAKNFIDPYSLEGSRVGIAVEEGLEMFGATLFLIGFSTFYRITQKGPARK